MDLPIASESQSLGSMNPLPSSIPSSLNIPLSSPATSFSRSQTVQLSGSLTPRRSGAMKSVEEILGTSTPLRGSESPVLLLPQTRTIGSLPTISLSNISLTKTPQSVPSIRLTPSIQSSRLCPSNPQISRSNTLDKSSSYLESPASTITDISRPSNSVNLPRSSLSRPSIKSPSEVPSEALIESITTCPLKDKILQILLINGYIIEHRLYEKDKLTYLLVKTKSGDKVFIRIDQEEYRKSFPSNFSGSDLMISRKSSITLVPQETKLNVLKCLDLDISGAVFICDNSICITEKLNNDPKKIQFKEENFLIRGNYILQGGKIGKSFIAYPVIDLSAILSSPQENESHIRKISKAITRMAYDKLEVLQDELEFATNKIENRVKNLKILLSCAQSELENEINGLEEAYDNVRDLDFESLNEEEQVTYFVILDNLERKKNLRTRLINNMAAVYGVTGILQAASDELEQIINPVVSEYFKSVGKLES